jgi:hypothetical protein
MRPRVSGKAEYLQWFVWAAFLIFAAGFGFRDGTHGGNPDYFGLFVWTGWVGLIGWLAVRKIVSSRKRARQIPEYARRAGLVYLGEKLPASFPLSATSICAAESIWNVVAGDTPGWELVFFDCQIGRGKRSFSQTAIAVRGSGDCFRGPRFDMSLTTERAEEWVLLYRPARVIPMEEIEALIWSFQLLAATPGRPDGV